MLLRSAPMLDPKPRVPSNLNPFARELLELLRGQPAARHFILGGGVALSHYLEYRETVDVDAWWRQGLTSESMEEALALLRPAMRVLAARHGLECSEREFGDTRSLELRGGTGKTFSFQVSRRDLELDPPVAAEWSPLWIETFRENLAAKMKALVNRGAPRDFTDIATACRAGFVTIDECWALWAAKTPGGSVPEQKINLLRLLEQIAARRPIEHILDAARRAEAVAVREFFRGQFCAMGGSER